MFNFLHIYPYAQSVRFCDNQEEFRAPRFMLSSRSVQLESHDHISSIFNKFPTEFRNDCVNEFLNAFLNELVNPLKNMRD